jgi:hypothetical protein
MRCASQLRETTVKAHRFTPDELRCRPVCGVSDCATKGANAVVQTIRSLETAPRVVKLKPAAKLAALPNLDRFQTAKRRQEDAQIVGSDEFFDRLFCRRNVAGESNSWGWPDTFSTQRQPKNEVTIREIGSDLALQEADVGGIKRVIRRLPLRTDSAIDLNP